jgi:uncharacterized membrane protein
VWLLLLACVTSTSDTRDTGSVDSQDPFCVDAPVVRWTNFGQAFVLGNCQGCHASTSPNRYEAPEHITFDDVDQVWDQRLMVLGVAAPEDATMPPSGGVHADDRMRLRWWLECAPEGT